jgi:hypothetical protein
VFSATIWLVVSAANWSDCRLLIALVLIAANWSVPSAVSWSLVSVLACAEVSAPTCCVLRWANWPAAR